MTTIAQALGLFALKVIGVGLLWCLMFGIIWTILHPSIHKDEE